MKENWQRFADFMLENPTQAGVKKYCAEHIDVHEAEMEEYGLQAAFEVIFKPSGIAIEVAYLDRSAGDVVSIHKFEPGPGNPVLGTVRLLYRP
jgi:ubiquitin thioesterase protein OTUB1